jgi:aminopeptidase N
MTKLQGMVLALALAGCASAGPRDWENTGPERFSTAQARCQIETQEVDEAQWEICMNGFGWWRTTGVIHDGGYDVLDVYLDLTPDPQTQTMSAAQTMQVRAEREITEIRFDANALTLAEATLDGDRMTSRVEDGALVFTFPYPIRPGRVTTLRFLYAGAPARGLVWAENGFYTSYFACDWMFCALDRPGDAFTFDVGFNGEVENWRSFSAEQARAYPAHVQGFAAGRWTEARERVGDTEFVFASMHASEADLRAMFAETARMQAFLTRRAGTRFPHETYTQLLVQGSAAQEGAGFAILGDDVVRPVLTDPHEDWAAAHEMAHAYWGNLITPKDWSHFWLSEGLTTFMVAAWKQERWGEADYQREIELATTRWARARDAGWDRPLAFAEPYPDLRTRRAIQYSKGMLFFVELRRVLGEDAFWSGVATYTRSNADGAVESADMQRAMEEASGRDLDALFAEWVYP